jgi:hypothetical protein
MEKVEVGDVIEEGPWAGFTLISRYTRAEAIADGVLIDVSERAREAGFTVPVAVTAAVWALVQPTEEEKSHGQDEQGRLWDLLWICRLTIKQSQTPGEELPFHCLFELHGRAGQGWGGSGLRKLAFKIHSGPGDDGEHVLTIMLPEED